jgi:hypothetical protein
LLSKSERKSQLSIKPSSQEEGAMKRRWLLAAVVLLPLLASSEDKNMVQWDIAINTTTGISAGGTVGVHFYPPFCTTNPPGCTSSPPEIVVTGSGTFLYGNKAYKVNGGGTWTRVAADNTTTSGTYVVTGVISFGPAPAFGGLPAPPDNIGNAADMRSGTAVLSVLYSDGTEGILILEGPDSMALGYVSALKGIEVYPATHGIGCTDGYCYTVGYTYPIFHVTATQGGN